MKLSQVLSNINQVEKSKKRGKPLQKTESDQDDDDVDMDVDNGGQKK